MIASALVATSLIGAPVVAQAAAAEQARLSADLEGEQLRGGFIIPLIALIAIILGICAATDICGGGDNDDDLPHSP
ncbi:MAG TPA: hypothetical protein VEB68_12220 [Croceibacterium sp.]|nr:hypothetical protein [Croceibacterium sp.]